MNQNKTESETDDASQTTQDIGTNGLAPNEHYFPGTNVYTDGRLGLDSRRAKNLGIEAGELVEVVIPSLDFQLPDVKLQKQHRLQIRPALREKYGIEEGGTYDVFIITDDEGADA